MCRERQHAKRTRKEAAKVRRVSVETSLQHARVGLIARHSTLTDLTSTVESLKEASIIKQIFMTSDISTMIARVYQDIDAAAKELQVC